LEFDLAKVYWCSRLAGERQRLIQDEFRHGQVIADAFCGAGALCVLAAKQLKNITIVANDLNPYAVQYAKQNAKQNGLSLNNGEDKEDEHNHDHNNEHDESNSKFHVVCGDARDFLVGLGVNEDRHAFATSSARTTSSISSTMDSCMPDEEVILPHHVVMNYPLDSAGFLDALRWWPTERPMQVVPTVHLYTFARADNPIIETTTTHTSNNHNDVNNEEEKEEPRTAMEVAIDMVADGLLPEYIATKRRAKYLNQLGCQVRAREVRLVAPGKMVIRVSFRVTRSLIRTMRGDFFEEDDMNDDDSDDIIIMEDPNK
jgi:tRNA (guanine37-N1)-methyltransferase